MTTAMPAVAISGKRKQSAAGLPSSGRTVKRRASKACQCCRSRKVRCDVVESGIPCTNCRLDEVECVVSDSKRRKKSYEDGDIFNQSPDSSLDENDELPPFPPYEDIDGARDLSISLDAMLGPTQASSLEHELNHHVPHMLYQTQGHRLSNEERRRRLSSISQTARPVLQSPLTAYNSPHYLPNHQPPRAITIPKFIQPLPPRIMADDIEYLQKKGALSIPETRLRDELLRSYVQHVHPYMPLLDLEDFLRPIQQNDGSTTISLFLFQAVMFAATAYIDLRFLQAQGFETRKAARKDFFQRTKLLYDFDYEHDRVRLVQALLLMTYWYETPDDQKDTWHWMGVSLSLAQTIGLHRNPENSTMSSKQQRLWKRIWWSCYMRDRLIALGMRRPTRIKNEDCDVPMLLLGDFETEGLPLDLVRMLGGCPAVRDTDKRTTLANLCIEMAKLCLCISHVLVAQYSVLSHKFGRTMETTMMLVPKKSAAESCEVMSCDQELAQWYDGLEADLRYFVHGTKERTNVNDGEVVKLHRALLSMIHLTTSSALHRPQVLPSAPNLVIADDLREVSRRKVREAASEITTIARDLYTHDLVRYLPTTGVTVLLPAIIIHLLDIKSSDANVREASLRRFYQCMQVLQRLREMYASADFAFSFLEVAIQKANIPMPATTPTGASRNLFKAGVRQPYLVDGAASQNKSLTPPPDPNTGPFSNLLANSTIAAGELGMFSALTPPRSDKFNISMPETVTDGAAVSMANLDNINSNGEYLKNDFDALINFDGGADLFAAEDGLGVQLDLDWMAAMPNGGRQEPDHDTAGGELKVETITGDLGTDLGMEE